jgi:hypothetical protein
MSSYTAQPPALRRVQYDPAADGSVTVTAFFETAITNDANPSDVITKPWEIVSFPLPAELAAQVSALATAALSNS